MLQPALNTPALNASGLNRSAPNAQSDVFAPASYGLLIAATRNAVDRAVAASGRRQPAADAALPDLFGNERFLRNAGSHLRLMMDLAGLRIDAITRLAVRVNQRPLREVTPGPWMDATAALGVGHDLVTTHLRDGAPRTPEATEKLLGPPAAVACRTITELILDAVAASENLIHQSELAHRREPHTLLPSTHLRRFRTRNQNVSVFARAILWDLTGLDNNAANGPGRSLDTLQVALPVEVAHVEPRTAHTSLAALRLLRQLLHDQARALAPASPASLRDLARLGIRLNDPKLVDPALLGAGENDTPLHRLRRAHARDQIDAARTAWSTAASELTTTVRGTTKAPGPYAAAVQTLLEKPLDPRTQQALLSVLPQIGRDAARTVEHLAAHGELVTLQTIPLQTRKAWRPITLEHADVLAARFTTAATASSRATAAIQDLHGPTTTLRDRSSREVEQRQLARVQHQAREATR